MGSILISNFVDTFSVFHGLNRMGRKETDRQTDRQTRRHTDRHAYRHRHADAQFRHVCMKKIFKNIWKTYFHISTFTGVIWKKKTTPTNNYSYDRDKIYFA